MTTSEREQRMAERILEDESLRGDLEEDAATALVDWASAQAAAAAADPDRTDAAVEAQVQAIRQAARAAARSGETEPQRLIALATAQLAPSHKPAPADAPAAATSASDRPSPSAPANVSASESGAPQSGVQPAGKAAAQAAVATPSDSPAPSAPQAKPTTDIPSKPVGTAGRRPRRQRSRLARFYKRLQGGR